jgi:benzoyl-CoA reductase/2-hydroxyglutaryl-CoA dehydratase subunit BcrC/BadD/HgdB
MSPHAFTGRESFSTALPAERPALGWFCSYTPVEIALAAGYLPVRLSGAEALSRRQDPRIYHLLCPFVRAVFQRFAAGSEAPPRALAFVHCCDALLRLHDLWKAYLPGRLHLLDLPKNSSPSAVAHFAQVLAAWAHDLSQEGPRPVLADNLWEAIAGMNRFRAFFREVFEAQRREPGRLPYSRVHDWVRRWLADPTESMLRAVARERSVLMAGRPTLGEGPRVLLTSTMLDQPGLIGLMEGAGLNLVVEDECMGARHFDGDVAEDRDPFQALAQRYLTKWPCPRMKGYGLRMARLDRVMAEAGVQGVIAVQLKCCDQSGLDLPLLKPHLEKKGIPLLILENDYVEGSLGPLRVRIEAFAEMLQEPWV